MTHLKATISLRSGRARQAAIQNPRMALATGMHHALHRRATALYVLFAAFVDAISVIA